MFRHDGTPYRTQQTRKDSETMNYTEAKAKGEELERRSKQAGERLRAIPGVGSGPMGLTPDSVKASPEYQKAKAEADKAFAELRAFNTFFVKQFARECREERRKRDEERAERSRYVS